MRRSGEDQILKAKTIYRLEKAFKNEMALMRRDDLFVRQLPSGKFILTVPHTTNDVEYVLNTYENRNAAREFSEVGRAVNAAFRVGARSIHFELLDPPAEID